MKKVGEINAVIIMATVSSMAVALFIRFPKAGLLMCVSWAVVCVLLTVVQQYRPTDGLRGQMGCVATAPSRVFLLATLTGLLVLSLLAAPIVWIVAACYSGIVVLNHLSSGSAPQEQ